MGALPTLRAATDPDRGGRRVLSVLDGSLNSGATLTVVAVQRPSPRRRRGARLWTVSEELTRIRWSGSTFSPTRRGLSECDPRQTNRDVTRIEAAIPAVTLHQGRTGGERLAAPRTVTRLPDYDSVRPGEVPLPGQPAGHRRRLRPVPRGHRAEGRADRARTSTATMSEAFFVLSGNGQALRRQRVDRRSPERLPLRAARAASTASATRRTTLRRSSMLFAPGAPREHYFEGLAQLGDMT